MKTAEEKDRLDEDVINFALKILTGKWKLKIIWEIASQDSIRFNELERRLDGISSLMLSKRLKELIDAKIISRKQFNEVPPHVEYSLTTLGASICPILHLLENLGNKVLQIDDLNMKK